MFVVQLPAGLDRDEIMRELAARRVQSKPYLPAIHLMMSIYRELLGHEPGEFPICEDTASRSLALSFFPGMSEGETEYVSRTLTGLIA